MITERALQEAIAECQGVREPNRETCMMLAAIYTIQDHLYPGRIKSDPPATGYSLDSGSKNGLIDYDSGTEFSHAITGRETAKIWPIMDELMTTLQAVYPRLYAGVMRQINEI